MIAAFVGASLGILTAGGLFAQSAAVPLTFEVASIKPSAPDARGTSLQLQPPDGLRVTNAPLRMLIIFAYNIRDFQLSGGPAWIGTERYDILAKAERAPGFENIPDDPRKMTDEKRTAKQEQMRNGCVPCWRNDSNSSSTAKPKKLRSTRWWLPKAGRNSRRCMSRRTAPWACGWAEVSSPAWLRPCSSWQTYSPPSWAARWSIRPSSKVSTTSRSNGRQTQVKGARSQANCLPESRRLLLQPIPMVPASSPRSRSNSASAWNRKKAPWRRS